MCDMKVEETLLIEELPVTKVWIDGRYKALLNFWDSSVHVKSGDRLSFEELEQLAELIKTRRPSAPLLLQYPVYGDH